MVIHVSSFVLYINIIQKQEHYNNQESLLSLISSTNNDQRLTKNLAHSTNDISLEITSPNTGITRITRYVIIECRQVISTVIMHDLPTIGDQRQIVNGIPINSYYRVIVS